jgi:hypothetical protein
MIDDVVERAEAKIDQYPHSLLRDVMLELIAELKAARAEVEAKTDTLNGVIEVAVQRQKDIERLQGWAEA